MPAERSLPERLAADVKRLPVSWGVTFLTIVIYLYLVLGFKHPTDSLVWRYLVPTIPQIGRGAWWGLLTGAFVHISFWHIFLNMVAMPVVGDYLEPVMGRWRLLAFIAAGAVISTATQIVFAQEMCNGFSGVFCALFGYLLARRREIPDFQYITTPLVTWLILGSLVVCIPLTALGIVPIANGAHMGGLVFGFLVGGYASERSRSLAMVGLVLMAALPVFACLYSPQLQAQQASAGNLEAQLALGNSLIQSEATRAEGLKWLEMAAAQGDSHAMNNVAWYLATDTDPSIRNGQEAVKWAKQIIANQKKVDPGTLDTVAAAYAEAGDFANAVSTEEKAIADAGGNKPDWQHRLDLYKQHKPYHE